MKIEIDPEDAFKAVIEELESDRRYLQWRQNGKSYVDGTVEKVKAILESGTRDHIAMAEVVSIILKGDEPWIQYLDQFGVSVEFEEGEKR